MVLNVALSSVFIEWPSDRKFYRIFQAAINCSRMWCDRRHARGEKGLLYKYWRSHQEINHHPAADDCLDGTPNQTRSSGWVSDIKAHWLLSPSLLNTLLVGNVGNNVCHTLCMTCLMWIHFFLFQYFPLLHQEVFLEETPHSMICSKDCKQGEGRSQLQDWNMECRDHESWRQIGEFEQGDAEEGSVCSRCHWSAMESTR